MGLGGFLGRLQDKWDDIDHIREQEIAKHSSQPFQHFVSPTISKTHSPSCTDEQLFLGECLHILNFLGTNQKWQSEISQSYFHKIHGQAVNIIADDCPPQALTIKYRETAQKYLFDAYFGFLYSQLLTRGYPRDEFRCIIDDAVAIMQEWQIISNEQKQYRNELFFGVFSERYSLSYDPYFVCPYCEEKIYEGIYNCPHCYEIIKQESITVTATKSSAYVQKQIDVQRSKHEQELRELESKHSEAVSEIEMLKNELIALRRMVEEKDLALRELQKFISDEQSKKIEKPKKILIIGASVINNESIISLLKEHELDEKFVDIETDYKKIKHITGKIIKSGAYQAVIVGPSPHKTKLTSESSFIETLKQKNIVVVEARNYQGALEINKESLSKALEILVLKLLSQRS